MVDVPATFQLESFWALDVVGHGATVRAEDRAGVNPEDGAGASAMRLSTEERSADR
jgi:hypothetical protein